MYNPPEGKHPVEFTDEGLAPGDPPIPTVSVRVELDRLTSHLQNVLQFELDAARLCLAGIEAAEGTEVDAPAAFFHLDPARNKKLPLQDLKEQARWWTQRNAFRNCVEALAPLLEFTRDVLALWSLRGLVKGEDYNNRMGPERKRYHRMGSDEKLKFLGETYGFEVAQDWRNLTSLLTQARNCLVHRGGRLAGVDCENGTLTVRWIRLGTFAERDGTRRPVGPGDFINEGEGLILARHPAEKVFRLGEVVHFTIGELNEICFTLLRFGMMLKAKLAKHGHALGVQGLDGQGPEHEPD